MRKTESKMNDLSVTGKIVSSGYKSRNQQTKTSTQPVRPQRRYSGVHKVNHIYSLYRSECSNFKHLHYLFRTIARLVSQNRLLVEVILNNMEQFLHNGFVNIHNFLEIKKAKTFFILNCQKKLLKDEYRKNVIYYNIFTISSIYIFLFTQIFKILALLK